MRLHSTALDQLRLSPEQAKQVPVVAAPKARDLLTDCSGNASLSQTDVVTTKKPLVPPVLGPCRGRVAPEVNSSAWSGGDPAGVSAPFITTVNSVAKPHARGRPVANDLHPHPGWRATNRDHIDQLASLRVKA